MYELLLSRQEECCLHFLQQQLRASYFASSLLPTDSSLHASCCAARDASATAHKVADDVGVPQTGAQSVIGRVADYTMEKASRWAALHHSRLARTL